MKISSFLILFFLIGCTLQKEDIPEHIRGRENLIVLEDAESNSSIELIRAMILEAPNNKFSHNWYKRVTGYHWLAGIEIDNSGRVYIADQNVKRIHVFDSDGTYLKSMGGEGSGPGEYYTITDTEIISEKLHVFDFMQFRTTIYSLDSLKVMRSENVRPPVNQGEINEINEWLRKPALLRSNGTYLAGFIERWPDSRVGSPNYNLKEDRPIKYYFMDKESYIFSDKIFELKKGKTDLVAKVSGRHLNNLRSFSFLGKPIITISDDNHIYKAWSDDFLIEVYGPDSNYLRTIYHPFKKKPLIRKEILPLFDKNDKWNRVLVKNAELPQTWPAINSIIADDKNRLWVSKIMSEGQKYEWWVLENTGELITKFIWPDNRSIKAVKNGFLYSCETDKETGQQKLVKYRFQIN